MSEFVEIIAELPDLVRGPTYAYRGSDIPAARVKIWRPSRLGQLSAGRLVSSPLAILDAPRGLLTPLHSESNNGSSETDSSDCSSDSEEEATEGGEKCSLTHRTRVTYHQMQILQSHLTEQIRSRRIRPTSDEMVAEIVGMDLGFDDVSARGLANHFLRSPCFDYAMQMLRRDDEAAHDEPRPD